MFLYVNNLCLNEFLGFSSMFSYCWSKLGYKHADKCQGIVLVAAGYMYSEIFGFSSHLNQDMDIIDV
jgi:hypothetical protein